jgi:hypothetical protein
MPTSPKDFSVDSVRVVKVLGGGLDHSRVVRGMVFGREAEGELMVAKNLAQEADGMFQVSSRRLPRPRLPCSRVVWILDRRRQRARCC